MGKWLVGKSDFDENPIIQLRLGLQLRVFQYEQERDALQERKKSKFVSLLTIVVVTLVNVASVSALNETERVRFQCSKYL